VVLARLLTSSISLLPVCFAQGRESIAAKLTANLITEAGADRVLAMDLHSGQCVGYFDIPVDHVYGETVILDYLASKRIATGELVVVSPDVGGVARARAFAKKLNDAPLAIIDKRRSAHNVSEVMHLIGDVKGKVAVLVDDMIDTAGTITNAGRALLQEGAKEVSSKVLGCAGGGGSFGIDTAAVQLDSEWLLD
jgi:ribose-phosphate pyrophosphokinase